MPFGEASLNCMPLSVTNHCRETKLTAVLKNCDSERQPRIRVTEVKTDARHDVHNLNLPQNICRIGPRDGRPTTVHNHPAGPTNPTQVHVQLLWPGTQTGWVLPGTKSENWSKSGCKPSSQTWKYKTSHRESGESAGIGPKALRWFLGAALGKIVHILGSWGDQLKGHTPQTVRLGHQHSWSTLSHQRTNV